MISNNMFYMNKIILLLSIAVFSCAPVKQVPNKVTSSPKVLVTIKDSLNSVVLSDTLDWQKIPYNSITDSTILNLKSDTLIMRRRNNSPFGPSNSIPFKINSKQLTTIKVYTLDSCFVKMESTFVKGSYRLELLDYRHGSGIYGFYFKNDEQIFKDRLILFK